MKHLYSIISYLYLASSLLCLSPTVLAQQDVRKYYPDCASFNPEAAGMLKALQYPVSPNTGVPEISIPLYEMKSRGIMLPLTLSYHAGGFKAREVAATTGLGWNLSANLQIVREVNGGDDFKRGLSEYAGYYYNKYGVTDEPFPDPSLTDTKHHYEILHGEIDSQPDRFYYNILGKSGSFVLSKTRNDRVFLPIPFNGISITCSSVSDKSSAVTFKITDTDGTEYNFTLSEVTSDPVNFSQAYESAWKCTSIIAPDKTDKITLDYIQLPSIYSRTAEDYLELYEDLRGVQGQPWLAYGGTIYASKVKEEAGNFYKEVMKRFAFFNLSVPRSILHSSGSDAGLLMYTLDDEQYGFHHTDQFGEEFKPFEWKATLQTRYTINRISTSNQALSFYYDSNKSLQSIELSDAKGGKIRNFYFDQSTVGTYQSAERTDRTNYLDRIRIMEASGTKKTLTYSFEYESRHAFSNYTKGGNYWGGLNSRTYNMYSARYTSVPPFQMESRYYKNNDYNDYIDDFHYWLGGDGMGDILSWNQPQLSYSLAGQLKKITYPTGGATEFEFEMNQAKYHSSGEVWYRTDAGGLRVSEIRYLDANGDLQHRKVYEYGENGEGIANGFPYNTSNIKTNPFFYKQDVEYIVNPSFDQSNFRYDIRWILEAKTTYLSNPLEGMNFNAGAPVYYQKVTEYDYGSSGVNGKKEYLYTAPDAFGYIIRRKIEDTSVLRFDEDWRRGQLEHENTYRYEGKGKYVLVHSVDYKYSYKEAQRTSHTDMPYQRRIYMGVSTTGDYPYRYSHFEIASASDMSKVGDGVSLYSNQIYSGVVYPVEKTQTSYDGGKTSVTVYNYSYDSFFQPTQTTVIYPDGQKETEVISYSATPGMRGVPVEIRHYDNTGDVDGMKRAFRIENRAQVERIYALAPGSGYYLKATFGYDAKDNLSYSMMNDAPQVVYLWGYDNQYPVAEIRDTDYATVCTALGEAVITTLQGSTDASYIRQRITELRAHPSMKKAQVRGFIHSPLIGVTEITEADGLTIKYNYDYLGRLKGTTDPTGFQNSYYDYNYIH